MPRITDDIIYRTDPFTGKIYENASELSNAYNLPPAVYRRRVHDGWSIKEALSIPNGARNNTRKRFVDHMGNEFTSIKEACKAWNISIWTYNHYKDKMSFEQIVKHIHENESTMPKTDHLGNVFDTFKDMCEHYGFKHPSCIRHRIEQGMDLKTALTTPSTDHNKTETDHLGNTYESITAMCAAYNIDPSDYFKAKRTGYSTAECLGVMPKINYKIANLIVDEHLKILHTVYSTNIVRGDFFICEYDKQETIMSRKAIVKYYQKYILKII